MGLGTGAAIMRRGFGLRSGQACGHRPGFRARIRSLESEIFPALIAQVDATFESDAEVELQDKLDSVYALLHDPWDEDEILHVCSGRGQGAGFRRARKTQSPV